ncbi:hypothetical protein WMY93_022466 [Mugilogobius chulae]|uniref:SH3 domain-containing protein n=1 Tax=Mugilogobius chulae TaxID=88201 RepID=A0AAW0NJC9_9GOBI
MSAVGITENAKGDNKKFESGATPETKFSSFRCKNTRNNHSDLAPTAEVKTAWVNEIRKVLTEQLHACRGTQTHTGYFRSQSTEELRDHPVVSSSNSPICLSPFRSAQKTQKNKEEKKAEPTTPNESPKHKVSEEAVTSPTSVARKRFTLQGFGNLKSPKVLSPEHTSKRHLVKSDPTPFGFKAALSSGGLTRVRWKSSSSLIQSTRTGTAPPAGRQWDCSALDDRQASVRPNSSHFTAEFHLSDCVFSPVSSLCFCPSSALFLSRFGPALVPVLVPVQAGLNPPCRWTFVRRTTDTRAEKSSELRHGRRRNQEAGRYTVLCDCDKTGPQELSVKSGDVVQLIREGDDGLWFVKNLRSSKEGWVSAANLLSLLSESKSSQS